MNILFICVASLLFSNFLIHNKKLNEGVKYLNYFLIIIFISIPGIALLMEIENTFSVFDNYSPFMYGFINGLLIVVVDGIIFLLMSAIKLFK